MFIYIHHHRVHNELSLWLPFYPTYLSNKVCMYVCVYLSMWLDSSVDSGIAPVSQGHGFQYRTLHTARIIISLMYEYFMNLCGRANKATRFSCCCCYCCLPLWTGCVSIAVLPPAFCSLVTCLYTSFYILWRTCKLPRAFLQSWQVKPAERTNIHS